MGVTTYSVCGHTWVCHLPQYVVIKFFKFLVQGSGPGLFLGACYKQVRALLRLVEWKQMSSNMFEKLPTFLMGKNQPGWPIE